MPLIDYLTRRIGSEPEKGFVKLSDWGHWQWVWPTEPRVVVTQWLEGKPLELVVRPTKELELVRVSVPCDAQVSDDLAAWIDEILADDGDESDGVWT